MLAPGRRVHGVVKWDLGHREPLCPWRSRSRPAPLGHRMYGRLAKVSWIMVSAAAAALCVKSLRRASSYSTVVIHPAECVPWRAWTPRTSGGERRSRTSCSSYVVANTGRIESSKLSMPPPTESAGGTAEPVLISDGKRHCGVGGRSGGRPPGASGSPGVLVMNEFKFAPCR